MNDDRRRDSFEEKLLGELKTVVARKGAEEDAAPVGSPRRPIRRHSPRLAFGAAAVVAAAAGVLVLSSGSSHTPAAFAVEPQDGGGVTIKVYSPEDASGLEAALAEAGIRSQVTWLPVGMACREPHFKPSTAKTAMGGTIGGMSMAGPGPAMTIGVMSADQYQELRREHDDGELSEKEFTDSTGNVIVDPSMLRPDQSVVISGAPGPSPDREVIAKGATGPFKVDPEGGYEAHFAIAEGAVAPCEAVAVPNGQGLLEEAVRVLEGEAAEHEAAQGTAAGLPAEGG